MTPMGLTVGLGHPRACSPAHVLRPVRLKSLLTVMAANKIGPYPLSRIYLLKGPAQHGFHLFLGILAAFFFLKPCSWVSNERKDFHLFVLKNPAAGRESQV